MLISHLLFKYILRSTRWSPTSPLGFVYYLTSYHLLGRRCSRDCRWWLADIRNYFTDHVPSACLNWKHIIIFANYAFVLYFKYTNWLNRCVIIRKNHYTLTLLTILIDLYDNRTLWPTWSLTCSRNKDDVLIFG